MIFHVGQNNVESSKSIGEKRGFTLFRQPQALGNNHLAFRPSVEHPMETDDDRVFPSQPSVDGDQPTLF